MHSGRLLSGDGLRDLRAFITARDERVIGAVVYCEHQTGFIAARRLLTARPARLFQRGDKARNFCARFSLRLERYRIHRPMQDISRCHGVAPALTCGTVGLRRRERRSQIRRRVNHRAANADGYTRGRRYIVVSLINLPAQTCQKNEINHIGGPSRYALLSSALLFRVKANFTSLHDRFTKA